MTEQLSFPRQFARTGGFRLGVPKDFTVSPDGARVAFVRSRHGTDRAGCLWVLDVATGTDRVVADPAVLLGAADEQLSAAERARRERMRETGSGVTSYATDADVTAAVFALSGRAWHVDLATGVAAELPTPGPVIDPRLDPTGAQVAYVAAGALRVVAADGSGDRAVAEPDGDAVTWGLAEFVAAEEMGRFRGFWWAPDGGALLAARVDESPVQVWYIADPANPEREPAAVRYPAAGTANAEVSLAVVGLDGSRVPVEWDVATFPYVVSVHWSEHGAPLVRVMTRDQRRAQVLALDPGTGATSVLHEETDDGWVDVVPGVPAWLPDGRLVTTAEREGTRRLVVGTGDAAQVLTPEGLQVAGVLSAGGDGVLVSATDDPTAAQVWLVAADGSGCTRVTDPDTHAGAVSAGGTTVVVTRRLEQPGVTVEVRRAGDRVASVVSHADVPVLRARPRLLTVGEHDLRVAVLLPSDHRRGTPLPVLMDPYGGPHAQMVVRSHNAYLESQWFADQGFAVVVADGRGTGSRGPEWDRAVRDDLAGVPVADQVEALHAVAAVEPDLDLSRVAIRGWSFGGYLSALAVLRRPDVFHAAVAGAPVVDYRLYDTFYTERYLGDPTASPDIYDRNSVLTDAAGLQRPLMIVHGLADDNVVVANSLRLSSALLAAGRPHTVLPLSGVTHMTPQEVVAENLLHLQVGFLHDALSAVATLPPASTDGAGEGPA